MSNEGEPEGPMDWLCECGHRYGDHHFLDEDCCMTNCLCVQFRGVEVRPDKGEDNA